MAAVFDGDVFPGESIMSPDILGEMPHIDVEPEAEDMMGGMMEEPPSFDANLAVTMPEDVYKPVIDDLLSSIKDDERSRDDWEKTYKEGLEFLGMKLENRTEPWDGACGVYHPILSMAAVKFQSEAVMETLPSTGPVRTKIVGHITPDKEAAAARVREDMNHQILDKMPEYRGEHEKALWALALSGNAFKKVYFDPNLRRQVSLYVPAEDILVPYGTTSLSSTERLTHVLRKTKNEVEKLQYSGFYRDDIDLPDPPLNPSRAAEDVKGKKDKITGTIPLNDNRYQIYEIHAELDLGEHPDGLPLPYVVSVIHGTDTILSIYRNWRENDPKQEKRNYFVHYVFVPGFGFYAFGLVHLIGGHAKGATSLLRQLVDAGTLANLPGGFKANGFRIKGGTEPIAPGEWRDVDIPGGRIQDNMMPLPYKDASPTLLNLYASLVQDAKDTVAIADMKVDSMNKETPVGTTLAVLERTLKVMSAVHSRLHYAMKEEFSLLSSIIKDFCEDEYSYEPHVPAPQPGQQPPPPQSLRDADYGMVEILPVSDPNASTLAQRIVQYQAVIQLAGMKPELYDQPYLHKQMLNAMGLQDVDRIISGGQQAPQMDPVTENMAMLTGKPVKAYLEQDHESHIAVHQAAMKDPKIMQMVGQSPAAQSIMAAGMAHLQEHIAFAYRRQVEQELGIAMPDPTQPLPKEVEPQISKLLADAADRVLKRNTMEQQAKQAEQAANDPIVKLQEREVAVKERDSQIKMLRELLSAAIEGDKIASQERQTGLKVGADLAKEQAKVGSNEMLAGFEAMTRMQERQKQQEQAAKQMEAMNGSGQQQPPLEGGQVGGGAVPPNIGGGDSPV